MLLIVTCKLRISICSWILNPYRCNANLLYCRRSFVHANHQKRYDSQQWAPVIGLEIHAQINSVSKLFSGAPNKFMSPPNSLVSNFDASMPGTLPVLNMVCVEKAITTALALNCRVNCTSYFDRKHYFYADMPQGYQITQQRRPIAVDGFLNYPTLDGSESKQVYIKQIQLEQDSGKSLHDKQVTFIDLNRAGVGLMEIVTGPDLTSADDSTAFIQELFTVLKRINTCDGRLEEGQFRVDINVSLKNEDGSHGTRAEVKNLYGLKIIGQVIDYEINRQKNILLEGGTVEQETRGFNDEEGFTYSMRDKEVLQDYRFMPEPNLPPLRVYNDATIDKAPHALEAINVDELRRKLPILPDQIRKILLTDFKFSFEQSQFIVEHNLDSYVIDLMSRAPTLEIAKVFEFIRIELLSYMYKNNLDSMDECSVTGEQLADVLMMEHNLEINISTVSEAFFEGIKQGKAPTLIVEENDWKMISDEKVVTKLCLEIIEEFEKRGSLTKYDSAKPKKNKKVISRMIQALRSKTNCKIHTSVAKKTIMNILGNREKT